MKFYENNPDYGQIYDWKKIFKEFNKIVPKGEYYNPTNMNFTKARINMLLSERSVGKTTNILILGMIANKHYNIRLHYIRNKQSEVRASIVSDLFNTINKFGYVSKITENRWSEVRYFQMERKWYYVNTDENGEVTERNSECLMYAMSIEKSSDYKSGYSCNNADFIIVDEFIVIDDFKNRFQSLQDILSTLIRFRQSPVILYLSNTVDKQHYLFDEYAISETVWSLAKGDREYITSELGTTIYVEYINEERINQKKKNVNRLYFGFKNEKLNAITGNDWYGKEYPHFFSEKTDVVLADNIYLEYYQRLQRLSIIKRENGVLLVYAHKATRTYDDSIIYTTNITEDNRCRYLYGNGSRLDKLLTTLYDHKAFRYGTNSDGLLVEKFYNEYKNK